MGLEFNDNTVFNELSTFKKTGLAIEALSILRRNSNLFEKDELFSPFIALERRIAIC